MCMAYSPAARAGDDTNPLRQAVLQNNAALVNQQIAAGSFIGAEEVAAAAAIANPSMVALLLEKSAVNVRKYGCQVLKASVINTASDPQDYPYGLQHSRYPMNSDEDKTEKNLKEAQQPAERAQIVKMLLDKGASPNCIMELGTSMLQNVLKSCEMAPVVKVLLDGGANPNLQRSPARRDIRYPANVLSQVFRNLQFDEQHDASRCQLPLYVKYLVEAKVDPNIYEFSPRNAHAVVLFESTVHYPKSHRAGLEMLDLLFKAGYKLNLAQVKEVQELYELAKRNAGNQFKGEAYYKEYFQMLSKNFQP